MQNNQPITQAEKAYRLLEEDIVSLQLKPGQVISENEISKKLNIGRMPIREAMKKLEFANLLVTLPRKGVMIKDITVEELLQQLEVRTVLERLIVERATKYLEEDDKKRLLELAVEYEEATKERNADKAVYVDNEFNILIGKASKNPSAFNAISPFQIAARRVYYLNYYIDEKLIYDINYAHIDLMRVMVTGDVEKALKQLDYLLQCIKKLNCLRLNLWT
ncbi:MAG: GntR family transcriptional regulator [Negativicutes bacterium]|nr:GntR family transcriptional regulator [Negativicutes bacterium]